MGATWRGRARTSAIAGVGVRNGSMGPHLWYGGAQLPCELLRSARSTAVHNNFSDVVSNTCEGDRAIYCGFDLYYTLRCSPW